MQSDERAVEYFQTYSDAGEPLELVPRDQVHAQGLWHCSAHVLLFNSVGELLLQRRSKNKDLYPNCWDYSVGNISCQVKPSGRALSGACMRNWDYG